MLMVEKVVFLGWCVVEVYGDSPEFTVSRFHILSLPPYFRQLDRYKTHSRMNKQQEIRRQSKTLVRG